MNPIARVALIFIPSAAFYAMAVLGWRGITPFFSHPALVALAISGFVLSCAAFFAPGGNLSPGEREDRSNRWIIAAFGLITLLLAYLPARTDRAGFWVLDGEIIRCIGVAVFVAGTALRLWPVFVLGRRFSGLVAIQPGHTLVTTGVYGVIRHPSYLGLLVSVLGWALAFRSGVGILLTALTAVPVIARIGPEEKLLGEEFGDEYRAYRARTSRLIPGIY
jgi:protein-S-isoprenylcysteine O-methyltransferase Ste14